MTSDERAKGSPTDRGQLEDDAEQSLARRLRDHRERVTGRIEATRARLEGARPGSRWIDTVFRTLERDAATGGGVLSAAVAFRIFMFLIPFVFFFVVGVGIASEAAHGDPVELTSSAGIAGLATSAIRNAGNLGLGERLTVLFVSGFALLLGARGMVKVLRVASGLIWQVPIKWRRGSARAVGAFIGLIIALMLTMGVVSWLRSESMVLGLAGIVVSTAVPFALWLFVSSRLPRAECPWWWLIPGAALFAIGVQVLHAITVYWFGYSVRSKTETYGAIGASLALLLWAYLLGRIVTASIALDAAFWYRRAEHAGEPVPAELDLEARLLEPVPERETAGP